MPQKHTQIRAFIAVSLPDHVKHYLGDLQKELRKAGVHGSYPKTESAHLTLRFLGDVAEDHVADICSCMTQAVSFLKEPIELTSAGIGVFPSAKNPRVIWAGVNGQTDLLGRLVQQINGLVHEQIGFKTDRKRYSPHLTLCRVKQRIAPEKTIELIQKMSGGQSEVFTVSSIDLYKSVLNPSGAVHTRLFATSPPR